MKLLIALALTMFMSRPLLSNHKKTDKESTSEYLWHCVSRHIGIKDFFPE